MAATHKILYVFRMLIFLVMYFFLSFNICAYSTYYSPRSINSYGFFDLYPELFAFEKKSFFLSPFVQRTFNSSDIAQQFTSNGFDSLVLDEQGLGDINPLWFDLSNAANNYYSTIKLSPEMLRLGSGVHVRTNFKTFFVQIDTSVVNMITNMHVQELDSPENGIIYTNSLQSNVLIQNGVIAFENPDFQYGKISGPLKTAGVEDIRCKIGKYYENIKINVTIINTPYIFCYLGTGKKPDAQYLFAPQVGTNNFGIGFGFSVLFEKPYDKVLFDCYVKYCAKASSTRSFDLANNGAWSRYLKVFKKSAVAQVAVPGINIFTQDAKVAPGAEFFLYARYDKTFGLYENYSWFGSYTFLGRTKEKIVSVSDIPGSYGIYPLGTTPLPNYPQTASTAQINQSAVGIGFNQISLDQPGGTFVGLGTSDLDLHSAAAQACVVNTISTGCKYSGRRVTTEIAGALEFPFDNKGVFAWTIWAVVGYSF